MARLERIRVTRRHPHAHYIFTSLSQSRSRTSGKAVLLEELDRVREDETDKERQNNLKKIREEFIGLMAQYGSTLKTPKDEEYLFLQIEPGLPHMRGDASRMTLKAKMSDVRAAAQERISLDAFKNRVQVWPQ